MTSEMSVPEEGSHIGEEPDVEHCTDLQIEIITFNNKHMSRVIIN